MAQVLKEQYVLMFAESPVKSTSTERALLTGLQQLATACLSGDDSLFATRERRTAVGNTYHGTHKS